MTYSEDLRRKVIDYYYSGHTVRETASVFNISISVISDWDHLYKETGSLSPKERKKGYRAQIDRNLVKAYVKEHPDAYQREIAEHFHCTQSGISRILKEIGLSLKKRQSATENKISLR